MENQQGFRRNSIEMKYGDLVLEWKCDACSTGNDMVTSPLRVLSTTFTVRSEDDIADDPADAIPDDIPDDIADNTADAIPDDIADAIPDDDIVEPHDSTIEDRSFNISKRDFNRPVAPLDTSIPDRALDDFVPADKPVTYEVVESGTKRGGRKLVSSDGYTYTAKRTNGGRTYWTCSIRGKKRTCHASVRQFGDVFTPPLSLTSAYYFSGTEQSQANVATASGRMVYVGL